MVVAVRAAFGLKGCPELHDRCAEAAQHVFDDVIRPNPKRVATDLGRHMTIAEMPCQSHELTRLRVSNVNDWLGRRSNDEPRPVVELHAVAIGHGDRGGQIEKYLVALVGEQTDAPAMPMIEVESDRAGRQFVRPFTGASMNDRPKRQDSHNQYRK